MTNITFAISQDHLSKSQTLDRLVQNVGDATHINVNFSRIAKKVLRLTSKSLIADIYMLLSSPVENPQKGGEA